MELNSFSFLPFFAVLLLLMLLVQSFRKPGREAAIHHIQLNLLLLFSCLFLLASDWRFCISLAAVTAAAYVLGIRIERSVRGKKIYLFLGILLLVLTLGYFKYTNFFAAGFARLFRVPDPSFRILLPMGISFYIFSSISYLIDVYRKKYPAEQSLRDFSLYMAFFPKLTAGPIVRGSDFLPQVKAYRGIRKPEFCEGIQIFVLGLFKKLVLADHLSVFVNDVFYAPSAYSTATVLLAILSYSLQIYLDFSGYSDMAIGISRILGFDLKPNFDLPYLADGISDFWKRWHISLSSWFRDYLYFPLGGSRKGYLRTCLNLMAVMLVSGLWHGAGVTFLIWGALHGLASCIEHTFRSRGVKLPRGVQIPLTFLTVSLLWVFFRASSVDNALEVLKAAFTLHNGISQPYTWTFFALDIVAAASVMAWIHSRKEGRRDKNGDLQVDGFYPLMDLERLPGLTAFFVVCGLILIMGYFGNTVFIYGNF